METKQTKFDRISDNKIEKIGDMIITMLEQGKAAQWKKPWLGTKNVIPAMNMAYNKPFTGINDFFLNMACAVSGWKTPFFLTFDQMKKKELHLNVIDYVKARDGKDIIYVLADGREITKSELSDIYHKAKATRGKKAREAAIAEYKKMCEGMDTINISIADYEALSDDEKKGWKAEYEKSFPVFQFHYVYVNKDGDRITYKQYADLSEEEQKQCWCYPQLMVFDEWNIDQTDMATVCPDEYAKLVAKVENKDSDIVQHKVNASDGVLDYMIQAKGGWRCPIGFGGDSAYYSPDEDRIQLPHREQFFTASRFYGTALHEMAHSNKPETKRDYKSQGFYSEGYATEELVAELTAAIMCHDLGIEKTIDEEHIAYVNSWMKACKDKDVIRHILDDLMTSVRYGMKWYEKTEKSMNEKNIAA